MVLEVDVEPLAAAGPGLPHGHGDHLHPHTRRRSVPVTMVSMRKAWMGPSQATLTNPTRRPYRRAPTQTREAGSAFTAALSKWPCHSYSIAAEGQRRPHARPKARRVR